MLKEIGIASVQYMSANTYHRPVAGDEREWECHHGTDDEHGVEDCEHGQDVAEGRLEVDIAGPENRAVNEPPRSWTIKDTTGLSTIPVFL